MALIVAPLRKCVDAAWMRDIVTSRVDSGIRMNRGSREVRWPASSKRLSLEGGRGVLAGRGGTAPRASMLQRVVVIGARNDTSCPVGFFIVTMWHLPNGI